MYTPGRRGQNPSRRQVRQQSVPLRQRRRFVSRTEFAAMSRDRRGCVPGREAPDEMAISVVTLAERSAGSHEVRPDTEQDVYFEAAERARRLDVLQRAEHEFDPIPFDTDAARAYGRATAALIAAGREARRRAVGP